ncbi:MAG: hypothetical protein E6I91_01745, partial [Chloroflexi bacterium]
MSVDGVLLMSDMPSNDTRMGTTTSNYAASRLIPAEKEEGSANSAGNGPLFENPFSIEDLQIFDDATMQRMLSSSGYGLTLEDLAWSLQGAPKPLVRRVRHDVPTRQRAHFQQELQRALQPGEVKAARQRVLDVLFWELTYWKTPDLYEELTEGEQLHPGIFQRLAPDIRGKIVLDAGAGSGRASFECLRKGAKLVYAVEPSPGLLHILEQKIGNQP